MKYKISFIIPMHNSEKTIIDTLNSINFPNVNLFEIIIIDDYSIDNSVSLVSSYIKKRPNCKLITLKSNNGPVIARKIGLESSNGEFIQFIDSDDELHPNYFNTIISFISKESFDLYEFKYILEKNGEKIFSSQRQFKSPITLDENLSFFECKTLSFKFSPSLCNKLFQKSLIVKVFNNLNPNLSFGEDFIIFLLLTKLKPRLLFIDSFLYLYKHNQHSITNSHKPLISQKVLILLSEINRINFINSNFIIQLKAYKLYLYYYYFYNSSINKIFPKESFFKKSFTFKLFLKINLKYKVFFSFLLMGFKPFLYFYFQKKFIKQ